MSPPTPSERFHRARRDPRLALLEGLHPLKHALRFGAEIVEAVAGDRAAALALAERLAPDLCDRLDTILVEVGGERFAALAPRPPATGVLAVARRPQHGAGELLADPGPAPLLLLERPNHLGNLGAAVRVAAAAGAAGLLTTGERDPWHPDALRAAAGLHFALPVTALSNAEAAGLLQRDGRGDRPLLAIHPDGQPIATPGAEPLTPRALLAFGSERSGLSADLLAAADGKIAIPMRPGVSSLNLATAVAVVLYAGYGGWRGPAG